jgi:hypothetical protein
LAAACSDVRASSYPRLRHRTLGSFTGVSEVRSPSRRRRSYRCAQRTGAPLPETGSGRCSASASGAGAVSHAALGRTWKQGVQVLRVDWPAYPRRAEHNTVAEGGNRRWAEIARQNAVPSRWPRPAIGPGRGPRWGRINAACSWRESPPVFVATERAAFDCLAIARIAGFDSQMGMVMLSRAEKLTRRPNSPRRSPVSAAEAVRSSASSISR